LAGTELYASFLLRPLAGFGFYGGVNIGNLFIGKSGAPGSVNYGLETSGEGITPSTIPVVADETALLVVRITFASGPDAIELFVNPAVGVPLGTPSVARSDVDLGVFDYVLVNNAGSFITDELRLATTLEEAVPIPEPSTIGAILALACLGTVLVRRSTRPCVARHR
jgi:hypothetical protein